MVSHGESFYRGISVTRVGHYRRRRAHEALFAMSSAKGQWDPAMPHKPNEERLKDINGL